MAESVYQSNPAAEPDANFVAGEIGLAVAGNRGRLLDARRTPLSLTAVDPERCEIEVHIDAFEDEGARWRLPAWEITRVQFAADSQLASPTVVEQLERGVEKFNRPFVVEADTSATTDTRRRVAEQRAHVRPLLADGLAFDLDACVVRREGDRRLYAELERYLTSQDLLEVDRRFCETMVSNPQSGELIKGHAIVLAELGLCPFEGTVVRDPGLFDEPFSRSRRADHLIARMAFAQELWATAASLPLTLYRAAAADDAGLSSRRPASFVSCTFSEQVADAHFTGGPATRSAVKWRQTIDPDRLLMTFLETAAFNDRFKEAEAVLLGDPSNPAF